MACRLVHFGKDRPALSEKIVIGDVSGHSIARAVGGRSVRVRLSIKGASSSVRGTQRRSKEPFTFAGYKASRKEERFFGDNFANAIQKKMI